MNLKTQQRPQTGTGPLFVGFDVGSSFVHYAVLGADQTVLYSPDPIMHFANPLGRHRRSMARHRVPL